MSPELAGAAIPRGVGPRALTGHVRGICRICGYRYRAHTTREADALQRAHYLTAPGHADATTAQLRERAGLPSWP